MVTRARDEWRALWDELVARGSRARARTATASSCGAPPKRRPTPTARSPATRTRSPPCCAATSRSRGITTVDRLADGDHAHRRRASRPGSRCSSTSGFALQGRYTDPTPVDTEWVARRLLARMHSYSRRTRRQRRRARHRARLHALPAALAARRARHPARGRSRARAPCSSSSRATRPPRWRGSPTCSRAGMRQLRPGVARPALPRRRGRLAAAHATRPRRRRRARPVRRRRPRPSRSSSATTSRGCSRRRVAAATRPSRRSARPPRSSRCCASAGACFAAELGAATNRLPEDIERALWDGVSPRPAHVRRLRRDPRPRRAARRATAPRRVACRACCAARARRAPAAGRWSLVPADRRRHRPRRARRGGRRAAAQPVGRGVPRPRRPRLGALPVARHPVGAAPARRPRPRARRAVRHRLQRRAVRAPPGARAAHAGAQARTYRRAGRR